MEAELAVIYQAVIDGNAPAVRAQVQAAIDQGVAADGILKGALIPAMTEVGRLFENGEFFVPEMLISARAMQSGLGILKPLLVAADVQPSGRVVVGTVKGDLHDIGKNLVSMMLEGAGFEVRDLGTDVSPERFVESAQQGDVDIIAMSALLTTTMPNMKNTLRALENAGLRSRVKVIVGGAPVTHAYARDIGADGYAPDASQAAGLAKTLIGQAV